MTGVLTRAEDTQRQTDTETKTTERWTQRLEVLCHKLRNIGGHQKLEEVGKSPRSDAPKGARSCQHMRFRPTAFGRWKIKMCRAKPSRSQNSVVAAP